MTPEDFAQLFTREALRPFQPRPGSEGLTPMLEVITPTQVAVFVLALDGFNDWPTRQGYLHALGEKCARDFPDVDVVRFGSEAWLRSFTPEEEAARGRRLIETYPDKQEAIIVFGQQADGTMIMAQAKLYRRPTGAVERVGAWDVRTPSRRWMRVPLLEAFWEGYRQGKGGLN